MESPTIMNISMLKLAVTVLSVLMLALPADADRAEVLVEAEAFKDAGGWVNDSQFMDQMGSPFLLAHGLGRPVDDAETTLGSIIF